MTTESSGIFRSFFPHYRQNPISCHPIPSLPSPVPNGSDPSQSQPLSIRAFYPLNFQEMLRGTFLGTLSAGAIILDDRRRMARATEIPRQGIALFFQNLHLQYPRLAPPVTIGYVGLAAPIFEEVMFNGILRNFLVENQTHSQAPTAMAMRIFTNASVFSLLHAEITRGFLFNLRVCRSAFVAGTFFSSIAELTDNLWGSTFAHSLVNLFVYRRQR